MSKSKPLNVKDRFGAELILCGGAILTRGEAAIMLTCEGVPRGAIDRCVYGVPKLSDEELLGLVRAELVLVLRLRYQGIFRERNENEGKQRKTGGAPAHRGIRREAGGFRD